MTDTTNSDPTDDILSGINLGGVIEGELDDNSTETQPTSDSQENEPEPGTSQEASTDATGGQSDDQGAEAKPKDKPTHGPQDLVDAQGNVIARGGPERRHYETAQRLKVENQAILRERDQLNAQLTALKEVGNLPDQYKLTPDQVVQGAQLIRGFLDNPIDTLNLLLTQAKAAGHNIDGVGAGTDVSAIKEMITEHLRPLTQQFETQQQQQEAATRSEQVFNEFNARHPDAQVHHPAIAQIMVRAQQQGRDMDVETAYLQLRNYYYANNLDWSTPIQEVMNQQQTSPNAPASPEQGEGIPTGNRGNGSTGVNEPYVADATTSTDDIIKLAMKEAGYNIRG